MRPPATLAMVAMTAMHGFAAESPTRLHIVMTAQSDAAPFWAAYLMELRRTSGNWDLRWVRVAPTSATCARIDVKATSRLVPNESVDRVFRTANPCDASQKQVSRVYPKNNVADLLEHPVDYVVVAECAGETRTLDLPQLPWERQLALEKRRHIAARLRNLYWNLSQAAGYGDQSPFVDLADEEDFQMQQQGEAIVPQLLSGSFDSGFEGAWRRALEKYDGPRHPATLRPKPQLLRAESSEGVDLTGLDFEYPPLASRARVQGRVSIDYRVDSETGSIQVLDGSETGPPLLIRSAITSLEGWRVTNAAKVGPGPFTAVIDYDLDRPACQMDKLP